MSSRFTRFDAVHSGIALLSEHDMTFGDEGNMDSGFLDWIGRFPNELKGITRLSSRRLAPKPRYVYVSFHSVPPELSPSALLSACHSLFEHLRLWADNPSSGIAVCYVMLPEESYDAAAAETGEEEADDDDDVKVVSEFGLLHGFTYNGRSRFVDKVLLQYYYTPMGKCPKPLEAPLGIAFGIRAAVRAVVDGTSYVLVLFERRTNAKCVLFPGGDKPVGVDPVQAVVTELEEECGLLLLVGGEDQPKQGAFPILSCGLLAVRYVGPWEIEYFPGNFMLTLRFDLGVLPSLPAVRTPEERGLGCFWFPEKTVLEEVRAIPEVKQSGVIKKNLIAVCQNEFKCFPWSDFESLEAFRPEEWCESNAYDRRVAVAKEIVRVGPHTFRVIRDGGVNVHIPTTSL